MTLLKPMKLLLIAGLSLAFIAITPVCGSLRWHNGETHAMEAGASSDAQSIGTADPAHQSPDERIAALEQSVNTLHADLAKLRVQLPRIIANANASAKLASELSRGMYPNPVPLYAPEGVSRYSVKEEPEKMLPPPRSLKRRREGVKSTSSLPRPGGEIQQKPAKNAKAEAEMIDVYFRTSGGAEAMTEVVHALQRLDENIRFSQNGDQLLVRTTRAGQEVVRQLIHYYEDELSDDK